MKTISGAFLSMLQSNASLVQADLYTITLSSGTVLRFTSAQQPVVYGGNTYQAAFLDSAPGFHRGQWRCSLGLNADDLELDVLYDASTRILGQTPASFAAAGGFDLAKVQVDKAMAPDWSNPVVNGVVNVFTGIVAETKSGDSKVALTVNSMTVLLNAAFPMNYFLPQDNNALFSPANGLSKSAYAVNGSVTTTGGSPTPSTFSSSCTQADGWFALGSVVWTSGVNNGLTSTVKAYANANGAFTLIYPLPTPPASGDTFTAYPGYDRTLAQSTSKFNNNARFRGFPYVPTPETLEVGGTGSQPPTSSGGLGGAGLPRIGRGPGGLSGNFKQQ